MIKSHLYNSILIALGVVLVMWMSLFFDKIFSLKLFELGVLPKSLKGIRGIFFSPLIHDNRNYSHIINNSFPTFILVFLIHQRFRSYFWKIFLLSWLISGSLVWTFAENSHSYHIGMSGVIYALAGFVFTVGVIIKHLPYQALSLFIVFIYGSLIWGIFPSPKPISWEGHLAGLLTGIFLAIVLKSNIPGRPKYSYEVDKELGIDPPDWEDLYNKQIQEQETINNSTQKEVKVIYDYKEDSESQENKKA